MSSLPIPCPPDHPFYPLYNALVNFKQGHVQPPSLYYVTRDDVLQFTIAAPIVQTTVNLSLRFMSAQGEILPRFETFTVGPTAGTPVIETLQNAEGYLLSASVFTPGAPRGQCFVSLAIKRGGGSGDSTFGDILLQGYPGQVGGIAYPQSLIASPLDGRGRMRSIVVANPAAGVEWSLTVPAGVSWQVRAVKLEFATAGGGGNRLPVIFFEDSTPNILAITQGAAQQAGGGDALFSWFQGQATNVLIDYNVSALPLELRMLAGWIIQGHTPGLAAGDQYSNIIVTVEEFVGG